MRNLAEEFYEPSYVRQVEETFPLADFNAWQITDASPKPFVMAGFIPRGEVTLVTGKGGSNKSTFGQQLATCCAAGVPMLGAQTQQMPSLYLTAEDDEDRLHWMQSHICARVGIPLGDLAGKLHVGSLRGRLQNEFATYNSAGSIVPGDAIKMLRATIQQTKSQLIVLDNSAHFFGGNENDRRDVTAFINLLYGLCRDYGSTVILIAHVNKGGDSWSGSTAWLNAVRSQIMLERPEGSADPDERLLTLGKANYSRQDAEIRFRWHDFALATEDELPADYTADLKQTTRIVNENSAFIKCLRSLQKSPGREVGPNPGPNYAPSRFASMPEAKGVTKATLTRAMERLFKAGEITTIQVKREGKGDTKTIIVETSQTTPERTPEPIPNTTPEPSRTPPDHPPEHTLIDKSISGAATQAAASLIDDWEGD